MKKIIFLMAAAAFSLNCGGGATNVSVKTTSPNTNSAGNASANKPASTPAATNTNTEKAETGSNPELDFDIVNGTGYDIKKVYVGPSNNKDWTEDMEVLNGRNFGDKDNLSIKFNPKVKAENWDIRVEWADGSPAEEWYKLNLTTIEKVTLKYDKAADKTTAIIE
jgi:hypothetical protein